MIPIIHRARALRAAKCKLLTGHLLASTLIHRALSWGKERIQFRQVVYSLAFLMRLLKKPVEIGGTGKVGRFSSRCQAKTRCTAAANPLTVGSELE